MKDAAFIVAACLSLYTQHAIKTTTVQSYYATLNLIPTSVGRNVSNPFAPLAGVMSLIL